ncbi:MAG TPA: response regulator [Hyphomicrobiaceae bacterium]|nr:response regulator [Hyphomicrobiaceae bacterium]
MPSQNHPLTILVIDDEQPVRTLLRECFDLEGFRVLEADSSVSALDQLSREPVDLVTLDLKLGGESGLELAAEMRARRNVPIVMITGKGDTIDRIVGLELGADDYITKPFHVREVLARVRAVLRRYDAGHAPDTAQPPAQAQQNQAERYAFAGLVLDCSARELATDTNERRDLTTAEFNMLEMFVRRPSRVLSRDNIMDILKGHDWSPYDRSIDALVVRLRRKIEPDPDMPRLIKTVRGVGYVFTPDVRKV